jgi:hypothetical protein
LEAIQQAVDLRRQLAADRPMVFNTYLVDALDRLSDCLSDLGHQEAAPHTTEEANSLRSLHTSINSLTTMGLKCWTRNHELLCRSLSATSEKMH